MSEIKTYMTAVRNSHKITIAMMVVRTANPIFTTFLIIGTCFRNLGEKKIQIRGDCLYLIHHFIDLCYLVICSGFCKPSLTLKIFSKLFCFIAQSTRKITTTQPFFFSLSWMKNKAVQYQLNNCRHRNGHERSNQTK